MNRRKLVAALSAVVAVTGGCAGRPAPVSDKELAAVPPELLAAARKNPRPTEPEAAPDPGPPAVPPAAPSDGSATPSAQPSAAPTAAPSAAASASAAPPAAPPGAKGTIGGKLTAPTPFAQRFAVVFIDNPPPGAAKKLEAVINQQGMRYSPYLTVVTAGSTVKFLNSDPFNHNVFSPDNEKFDVGTWGQGGARSHVFDKIGAYRILCNLHPQMLAYVMVVPSTYYAQVDAKGRFAIADVPAGSYQVSAWAPQSKKATQTVSVTGGAVDIAIKLQKGSRW